MTDNCLGDSVPAAFGKVCRGGSIKKSSGGAGRGGEGRDRRDGKGTCTQREPVLWAAADTRSNTKNARRIGRQTRTRLFEV